jgi:hypothetical protein
VRCRAAVIVLSLGFAGCSGQRVLPAATPVVDSGDQADATEHVRLYAPSASGQMRGDLLRVLDTSTRRFVALIPGGPEPVIEVYLFESEAAWRTAVSARLPAGVHLGRGMSRGAVTIGGASYLFDIGGHDALRLAAHEAWHAWVQRALHSRLPLWLDEAFATRAEGLYLPPGEGEPIFDARANPTRRTHLRRLLASGRLGSLEDHLGSDPAQLTDSVRALDDYYARAWVLGLLLEASDLAPRVSEGLEWGVFGTLTGGVDAPLVAVLGVTADDLDSRWKRLAYELAGD